MDVTKVTDLVTQLATEVGLTVTPPGPATGPSGPPVDPPPILVPGPILRVVHWNTHHGGVPVTETGVDAKLNVDAITDWLVKLTPDLVSLNELEENDGYGVMDQLDHHRVALQQAQGVPWYGAFIAYSGSAKLQGGGSGLLTKSPLGTIVRKGLTGTRSILYAQTPLGSVYTTHLSNNSAADRTQQVQEAILFQARFPRDKVILCGDLNAVPGSPELSPFTALYQDAWAVASAAGTATSFKPGGITHGVHRIDYVWVKGFEIVSVAVPDTREGGLYPSDHHPVVVQLR